MATAKKHKHQNCVKLIAASIGKKPPHKSLGIGTIDDDAHNIFQSQEGKQMVKQIESFLERDYADVYDGSKQELITFPPRYDYGVETKNKQAARAMQYGNEADARKRIAELKGSKKAEDVKERNFLEEKVLRDKQPLAAEADVLKRFQDMFSKEPGLCLHGFKPSTYLAPLRVMAKEAIKNMNPNSIDLIQLQKQCLRMLNITDTGIKKWTNDQIQNIEIKQMQLSDNVTGATIWDALDLHSPPTERKNQFAQLKKLFPKFEREIINGKGVDKKDDQGNKMETTYTKDEIRYKILQSEFDRVTTFDDEYDMILFLPKLSAFFAMIN